MVSIPRLLILIGFSPMVVYTFYWLASPYENCVREAVRDEVKYESEFEKNFSQLRDYCKKNTRW
ncbi:MAG: hypothetical protein CMQ39_07380 [Gammaproteobacteria bacterium]|nr:hypothetical protein [Gammaproteobacteria bacterium]|tara:strand:- start:99 stop:290 length:192 start_codon:yes stop_codon:yes gene_type:complete